MKILAVDTSTASGSVALLDGETPVIEWALHSARTHNRRLLKTVDRLLGEVGWEPGGLDGFAVTTGPGSFTGLRIGLTTVKTLAWTLKKPFLGISSLDALAAPLGFASMPVCTILDARKNELYFALHMPDGRGGVQRVGDCEAIPPERLPERIHTPTLFCGDGWLLAGTFLGEKLGELAIGAPGYCHVIRAGVVGELARKKFLAGERDDPLTAVPLYVRPSEAEIKNPHPANHADPPENSPNG